MVVVYASPANLTTTGETYVNTSQWIGVRNDTGATVTLSSFSGAGTNSISCSTGVNSTSVTVYAKINKHNQLFVRRLK